jgi:hypothetical protein
VERSYNPKWYDNEQRKEHCLKLADESEALFMKLTSAEKSTLEQDLKHIDCFWDGVKVDVKGLKPMHLDGYILVEMINTWGTTGWCAKKSKAQYIAFQFEDHFLYVSKERLRELTLLLCPHYRTDEVERRNYITPEEGMHKWVGRANKQDVFTYLTYEEVKGITEKIISF